jgi:hypothetical protein
MLEFFRVLADAGVVVTLREVRYGPVCGTGCDLFILWARSLVCGPSLGSL